MESILDQLVEGWVSHFWAADHSITWLGVEEPLIYWLDEITALVGVGDARGLTGEGKPFFGEWKTAKPWEKNTWKQVWRKNPQSLTYGVLYQATYPDMVDFTVRKAFKPVSAKGKLSEPSFDHAWYTYSESELRHWRFQLMTIASEIRAYRASGHPSYPSNGDTVLGEKGSQGTVQPWPTNFRSCFEYGVKYPCPFFEGCDHEKWGLVPLDALVLPDPRLKTLPPSAREWGARNLSRSGASNELVVLSASAVDTWLRCRERFRKQHEVGLDFPSNEAAQLGADFHSALAKYYRTLDH